MLPTVGTKVCGFDVVRVVPRVAEEDCALVELVHEPTGLRVAKLTPLEPGYPEFSALIAFSTPPTDDSGLPHIVEHSVLCGSKRYPLPAPFEELSQGSLRTYLNAGTYNTFTVYPFASRSRDDYFNIMAIYLDAVFQPLLLEDPRVFGQEGWHLHMDTEDSVPDRRGVVLNEMRGVFSEPARLARFALKHALFEGGSLAYESGGHPSSIVNLSADDLAAFHRKHYNPRNARVAYHSTIPLEDELAFLRDTYLRPYEAGGTGEEKASLIACPFVPAPMPPASISDDPIYCNYPVSSETTGTATQGQLVRMWRTYDVTEVSALERVAFDILLLLLFQSSTSPVLSHLQRLGLISGLSYSDDDANRQAYVSLQLRGCGHKVSDYNLLRVQLLRVFELLYHGNSSRGPTDPLEDYDAYLSDARVLATLSSYEFNRRERDSNHGVSVLSALQFHWLHGCPPEAYLRYEAELAELRRLQARGELVSYIRTLLFKYFVENGAWKDVVLVPVPGSNEQESFRLQQEMTSLRSRMTAEEIRRTVDLTTRIKDRHRECRQEDVDAFPRLSLRALEGLEDEHLRLRTFTSHGTSRHDTPVVVHNTGSAGNGVVYLKLLVDVTDLISPETAPLLSLLASGFLGKVRTLRFQSPEELETAILQTLGHFSAKLECRHVEVTPKEREEHPARVYISLAASFLEACLEEAVPLIFEEIWQNSAVGLADLRKVYLLAQAMRTRVGNHFLRRMGYTVAATRAMVQQGSLGAVVEDLTNGISFLDYLRGLFDGCAASTPDDLSGAALEMATALSEKLSTLHGQLLKRRTSFAVVLGVNAPELAACERERVIGLTESDDIERVISRLPAVLAVRKFLDTYYRLEPYEVNAWTVRPATMPLAALFDAQTSLGAFNSVAAPVEVNFVARAVRLPPRDLSGAELLLTHILSMDYLHTRVRVQGGAYGCFVVLGRSRWLYVTSYMDPNLAETMRVFDGLAEYLQSLSFDDRALTVYKIGAVGKRQIDLSPKACFYAAADYWVEGRSVNDYRRAVGQIARTSLNDLRALLSEFSALKSAPTVVFGKIADVRAAAAQKLIAPPQDYLL
ncbi:Metalloprotease, insulinase family [Giardia muris]|uniref:Metalloprotease, insulinase family n=1 Tax=Giardia muris TaxID=5742 RepID=A0A4Z1SXD6_GIAMU|nr:Metalloprotease, insulinase family [Giardia muris]|eukprot:TNJ26363.1 Metalloprotease, insulinase family [Giardia muris]